MYFHHALFFGQISYFHALFSSNTETRSLIGPNEKQIRPVEFQTTCRQKIINVAHQLNSCLGSVEDIVGNGENNGYQHKFFSCYHNLFKRLLF